MRKFIYSAMTLAAAAAFAMPAVAQPLGYHHGRHVYRHHHVTRHHDVRPAYRADRDAPGYRAYAYAPAQEEMDHTGAVAAGVVGGTVAGLGTSEGWWGSSVAGVALPTTVAGAAVVGGVAGIGTAALVDAATEPCRGFAAMFDLSHGECVNGHYVGPRAAPPLYRR